MNYLDRSDDDRTVQSGDVPLLKNRIIERGERWIFSAGFNVRPQLGETSRIDSELDDLRRLSRAGTKVAILSHQGNFGDGTALHLDFVAHYLTLRLGQPVRYIPTIVGAEAATCARALRDGEVAVFGNARHHEGEASNESGLAKAFSALGDFVAVGGFSKAHRAHASNVGILKFLPGYLANSVTREIAFLAPWAGENRSALSIAVLGGQKREKTTVALAGFCRCYDVVIPGGAVLNNILKVLGYPIGASYLGENPAITLDAARQALGAPRQAQIFIPQQIVVATRCGDEYRHPRIVILGSRVENDEAIVDFYLDSDMLATLKQLVATQGRLLVAGTPSLYEQGFQASCKPILAAADALDGGAILLGGDTTAELPFDGAKSAGGGSALHYLCNGILPIQTALATQSSRGVAA